MTSDTPKTDAMLVLMADNYSDVDILKCVPAGLARRLERENAALRAQLSYCVENLEGIRADDDFPSSVIIDKSKALLAEDKT